MPQFLERVSPPTGYTRTPGEVHTEYPKWLHFPTGPSVLVDSPEAEAHILAGGSAEPAVEAPVVVAPIPNLVGANDELTMLKKIAADKGIAIDGRWSVKKIRAKLEAASA